MFHKLSGKLKSMFALTIIFSYIIPDTSPLLSNTTLPGELHRNRELIITYFSYYRRSNGIYPRHVDISLLRLGCQGRTINDLYLYNETRRGLSSPFCNYLFRVQSVSRNHFRVSFINKTTNVGGIIDETSQ